jgi:hypothetical protein
VEVGEVKPDGVSVAWGVRLLASEAAVRVAALRVARTS